MEQPVLSKNLINCLLQRKARNDFDTEGDVDAPN